MKGKFTLKVKIIIVAIITCVAAIATFLVTKSRPQLYAVNSSFYVQNLPIKTTADFSRLAVSSIKDKSIVDSVSAFYNITVETYDSRVSASVDSRKCISMIVSAETPEDAAGMSEMIIDLLNKKMQNIVAEQTQKDMEDISNQMVTKIRNVDSLKNVISMIDSTVSQNVSKSGARKDILIEHKILLEKNPDYIFESKLIEKLANDYGAMMAEQAEAQNQINKQYITTISAPDSNRAYNQTNKAKIILTVTFLAFVCSICMVTFIDMIRQRKSNIANK